MKGGRMDMASFLELRPGKRLEVIVEIDAGTSAELADLAVDIVLDAALTPDLRSAACAALARCGGQARIDRLLPVFLAGQRHRSQDTLLALSLHGSFRALQAAFPRLLLLTRNAHQNAMPPDSLQAVAWAGRYAEKDPGPVMELLAVIRTRGVDWGVENELIPLVDRPPDTPVTSRDVEPLLAFSRRSS